MKLKLSNISLKNSKIIKLICATINFNKNLLHLDLSFCQLKAPQLNRIASQLAEDSKRLKNLNLGYNLLNFSDDHIDYEDSLEFMSNIIEFFKQDVYLNHLNFSGMNFK